MTSAVDIAVPFIAQKEGFVGTPYTDVAGNWTYGYGFIYDASGARVQADTPAIPQEVAYNRLIALVTRTSDLVRNLVQTEATEHQIAALTSFAYNLGTAPLSRSTLLREFNAGNTEGAAECFSEWVYSAGKVIQGLVNRRAEERAMFLTPDDDDSDDAPATTTLA